MMATYLLAYCYRKNLSYEYGIGRTFMQSDAQQVTPALIEEWERIIKSNDEIDSLVVFSVQQIGHP